MGQSSVVILHLLLAFTASFAIMAATGNLNERVQFFNGMCGNFFDWIGKI
jgi:hypothetical protein